MSNEKFCHEDTKARIQVLLCALVAKLYASLADFANLCALCVFAVSNGGWGNQPRGIKVN